MAFTYFFRDKQTLNFIQDYAIPKIRTRRYIRIWDAGCAMGPEPYSLAILLREKMSRFLFRNVKILATDINNCFGEIIKKGVYDREEVCRIPGTILKKYFSPLEDDPNRFAISEELRKSLEFLEHDLLCFESPRSGFCLIMCKNVLLHFKKEERIKVINMFHKALEQGGFLVVENTQDMPEGIAHKFERVVSNAQLFRKL